MFLVRQLAGNIVQIFQFGLKFPFDLPHTIFEIVLCHGDLLNLDVKLFGSGLTFFYFPSDTLFNFFNINFDTLDLNFCIDSLVPDLTINRLSLNLALIYIS
jgi:hypothetical protein